MNRHCSFMLRYTWHAGRLPTFRASAKTLRRDMVASGSAPPRRADHKALKPAWKDTSQQARDLGPSVVVVADMWVRALSRRRI